MKPAVQHFDISSNDYHKAKEFYKEVFEWEFNQPEGMEYILVAPGGENSIGGGIGPAPEGKKPTVTFYITVDNIQSYLDKVKKAGGQVIIPPMTVDNVGEFGMFADLDGNQIGLYKTLDKKE